MSIKTRIALRYLSGKNRYFLSFANLIGFLGIVIGLFSLNIVASVMNGLSQDMQKRIISTKGDLRIFNKDFSPIFDYTQLIDNLVTEYPEISIAAPVNQGEFLLRRRNLTAYSENFGIDIIKHKDISAILNMMRIGNPTAEAFQNNGIILGLDISFQLNATVGDTVDVVSPSILIPTSLGLVPRMERYRVVGIFQSGLPEFDRLYSFIDIEKSKGFKRHTGVDFIEVKTTNNGKEIRPQIERDHPYLSAQHWSEYDSTLFQAIQVEKIAMLIVLSIILVLASFNITGNFIRTATEKREEIAILKTLGMNKNDIIHFFVIMGFFVCIAGIMVANILAYFLLFLQDKYAMILIPVPGFPFTAVPVDISLIRMLMYSFLTMAICMIGTFYPAYKALRINIIDVFKEHK